MEIGDIFVVNKADRPGAERRSRRYGPCWRRARPRGSDCPGRVRGGPGLANGAAARHQDRSESGEGVGELVEALDSRWARLESSGGLEDRRKRGAVAEARALLSDRVLAELEALEGGLEEELADEIVRGEREAAEAADILFDSIRKTRRQGMKALKLDHVGIAVEGLDEAIELYSGLLGLEHAGIETVEEQKVGLPFWSLEPAKPGARLRWAGHRARAPRVDGSRGPHRQVHRLEGSGHPAHSLPRRGPRRGPRRTQGRRNEAHRRKAPLRRRRSAHRLPSPEIHERGPCRALRA